jgi:hypothetical protein
MSPSAARWIKSISAVLLGNAFYFFLLPSLPPAAQHKPMELDIGVLVDFWFCLFTYGIIEAGIQLSRWLRSRE